MTEEEAGKIEGEKAGRVIGEEAEELANEEALRTKSLRGEATSKKKKTERNWGGEAARSARKGTTLLVEGK